MIKKGLLYGGMVITMLITVVYFQYNDTAKNPSAETIEKDGNAIARAKWMKSRLVDPQTGEIPIHMRMKEMAFSKTLPKANAHSFSRSDDSLTYKRRGPHNVGGRTRAFAVDLTNSSTLLAGGVSGGLWRSTDFGASWKQVSPNDQALNITCLAQDPRPGKKDTWYMGTGEGRGSLQGGAITLLGNGLFKSTDKGITWKSLTSTQITDVQTPGDWGITWKIAIDPSNVNQDELYVAANGVIMKSTDGGTTWKKVLGDGSSSSANFADVLVTSTGVVYAAMSKSINQSNPGVWRSVDGENWVNITGSSWPSNYERIVFDVSKSNENVLMFLARTPGSGAKADPTSTSNESSSLFKYTYRSGNGTGAGGTWVNYSNNIPSDQNPYYTFDTQGNYNMVLKIDPFDNDIVYIGSTNLFRSTDGFSTSNNVVQIGGYNPKILNDPREYRYPNQHPDQHEIFFQPNNSSEAFTTTDGGISYTNNIKAAEVEWEFKNTGYFTSQFYTVAIDHRVKNDVVVGGLQDNGTHMTSNQSVNRDWTDPLQSDGAYCAVEDGTLSDGSGTYYMSSQFGRTYKIRVDNTGEATIAERIEPQPVNGFNRSVNYSFINPFELDYADNNFMYMLFKNSASGPSKIKVYKTLKLLPINGNNSERTDWSEINFTFPGTITAMVSSRSNPAHRLYVGCSEGSTFMVENANTNNPTVTRLAEISGVLKGNYVSDFAVHPEDADKVLLTYSNYNAYSVFYSKDGGTTWETVAGNLEEPLAPGVPQQARGLGNGPSVRCAAILETDSGTAYFVGTSVGLYATNELNGDETVWAQQAPDLIGNAVVEKFDTRDNDNYLAIATHGSGVFGVEVTTSSAIGVEESNHIQQTKVTLYPNPVKTELAVSLSGFEGKVKGYQVYDALGRLRKEGPIDAAVDVRLDVSDLSSGIYYLTLQGVGVDVSKKFVVNN